MDTENQAVTTANLANYSHLLFSVIQRPLLDKRCALGNGHCIWRVNVCHFPFFFSPRTWAAGSCGGKTRENLGVWITKIFRYDLWILQVLVFQPIATKNVYCYFWCIISGKKNLNFFGLSYLSFFDPRLCKKSTFLRVSEKCGLLHADYFLVLRWLIYRFFAPLITSILCKKWLIHVLLGITWWLHFGGRNRPIKSPLSAP